MLVVHDSFASSHLTSDLELNVVSHWLFLAFPFVLVNPPSLVEVVLAGVELDVGVVTVAIRP